MNGREFPWSLFPISKNSQPPTPQSKRQTENENSTGAVRIQFLYIVADYRWNAPPNRGVVMSLVFQEETGVLRRGFFDVQNEVGLGRDEEDYHQALKLWLQHNRVPFFSKKPHALHVGSQLAHKLYPDFVVWDQITIELKALPRHLRSTEFVQLFDYLKCRGDRLGLLVNMGLDHVKVERVVYDPTVTVLDEDWSYWSGKIDGKNRDVGVRVCQALRQVYAEHESGYGDEVLRKLIRYACRSIGLSVVERPSAPSSFCNVYIGESPLDCRLVEDEILLSFSALFDNNDWNTNRCRSYLRALDKNWGIAANFGRSVVSLLGVHRS